MAMASQVALASFAMVWPSALHTSELRLSNIALVKHFLFLDFIIETINKT